MRLWEIVDNAAAVEPDRTALVAEGRRWDFAALRRTVDGLGTALTALVSPGDRVAVLADNRAAYVAALYAVPRAGAVLVHCNTRHTPAELEEVLRGCGVRALIGTAEQLRRLAAVDPPALRVRICLDDETAGALQISELLCTDPAAPVQTDDADTAWLVHTSGTTGHPKAAMLTHRSLVAAALNTTMARPVAEDEVYLFPFPLFHVAAYNVVHHHLRRRPVVLLPRFDAATVCSAIQAHAVTSVSLAPTMLAMLLDHFDRERHDLSSLRTVSYGAAAMPVELLRRSLRELPGVGLAQGYGMTELSGNAVFLSPEDHRRAATDDPELLTAAGRPAPLTALRVVDDEGVDVEPGERGEIVVRGDQVCAGYLGDAAATAAAIVEGWLHTGDIGRIDERGYLHVLDRRKDIIITGGENVSSREVEDALGTHPAVQSVAVIGLPDPRWGERVVAVVVAPPRSTPPTLEELRGCCEQLAGYKHPRDVVVLDALPTNASGKVDKVALRELAHAELGDSAPPNSD